jgi:hypothetical protein
VFIEILRAAGGLGSGVVTTVGFGAGVVATGLGDGETAGAGVGVGVTSGLQALKRLTTVRIETTTKTNLRIEYLLLTVV